MKKFFMTFLLLALVVWLSSCDETGRYKPPCDHPTIVTDTPSDHIYQLGERINLYYEGEDESFGYLIIHNAVVLEEDKVHVKIDGENDVVDAAVQINYEFHLASPLPCLVEENFVFTDHAGNPGLHLFAEAWDFDDYQFPPDYTEHSLMQCALVDNGEYLYVDFIDCDGSFVARVQAFYSEGELELAPAETVLLFAIGIAIVMLLFLLIRQVSFGKRLRQQLTEQFFSRHTTPTATDDTPAQEDSAPTENDQEVHE